MRQRNLRVAAHVAGALVVAAGLWLTSTHSYLLFHSLVEIFGIVVAAAMFAVAWNSRSFSGNGYLTFIGIAYLFTGCLDLLHTLAYKGMGVFATPGANLATQLWIAGRALGSVSLLVSPLFLVRRIRAGLTLAAYGAATAFLLLLVFPLGVFPVCYVDAGPAAGLTTFKVTAEYVVCAILAGSLFALWTVRQRVSRPVLHLMLAGIATSIVSELAFTHYVSVYAEFNMIGHLLKTASFYLVFKATVEATLKDPYQALFRDLQEQERYLADANRMKDEFLATLSHELRTPLNAVVGWSQMLLNGRLDAAASRRAIEVIDRSARAQVALINDALDVSRIISGKLRLDVQRMEVADSVQAALDAVAPAAAAKGIEITLAAEGPTTVVGDPDRIQQVAWNILSNAVKFTPKGGRIDVAVRARNSEIELQVRDTGMGVPADALPHLFERFWQADRAVTRRHGGLGLGLAIVRHLVELHGGRVWAESKGEGHGTTVTIALPVRAVSEEGRETDRRELCDLPAGSPNASLGLLSGVKVLVVDDEADARELLERILRDFGAQAKTASSAEEGLQQLQAWRPHVVLSDIGMPDVDGYEFIRSVRALPVDRGGLTPAIALTAYGREQDRGMALAAGFEQHLTKPVTPAAVKAAVADLARTS